MDAYVDRLLSVRVSGVEARHWVSFFKTYAENADPAIVTDKLERLLRTEMGAPTDEAAANVVELLREIADTLT